MRLSQWHWGLVAVCVLALGLLSACGEDSEPTDTDGDVPADGDESPDGDEEPEDGDVADGDAPEDGDDPDDQTDDYQGSSIRGQMLIPRGAGVCLTPGSYDQDGEPGDGSWRTVDNYLTDLIASNFAYTAEGLVLGYGPLSRQVKFASYAVALPADNGALLALVEGPFASTKIIPIEQGTFLYLYLEDGDTTYYLRIEYTYRTGAGVHGNYVLSTSPKFP